MDDTEKRRREWFQDYVTRIQRVVKNSPYSETFYLCPCCGYPTLHERGGYEICLLCNWEEEGQDDPHADESWDGANGRYSLAEALENFKNNMIMYGLIDPRIGGSDSLVENNAKSSMIEAFDQMPDETNLEAINKLWEKVGESRNILHMEVVRRVREYEELNKKSSL